MPALLLLAFFCAFADPSRAEDLHLIRPGEIWHYFKGVTEPSARLGEWLTRDFDDSLWLESISGFSTIAYNPEPGYLYDYGVSYRTVYFRHMFEVQQPLSLGELTFRIDYDDAFVVYLNGVEVLRRGVPGTVNEPVLVATLATAVHPRGATEEIDLSSAIPLLHAGQNLCAVQVLGSSTNDYSVAFLPELLGNFTRGPYVQNTSSNSTQIIFKTLSAAPAFVEVRTNGGPTSRIVLAPVETNHVATLSDLLAATDYQYRVGATFSGREVASDWHPVHTFKPAGSMSFDVLGDSGWGSEVQYQIAAQMQAANPDLIMLVGDAVYPAYSHFAEDFRLMSVYAEQMTTTPVFLVLGNHEGYGDIEAALASFYLPTNNATGDEKFYSFDQGDAHFMVLWVDLQSGVDYSPGSVEYRWAEHDLAATDKPWKFMFFHHVWRSSGPHFHDDYDENKIPDWIQLEQGPIALAKKYGVQVVFNGHDHDYERLAPSAGVISFVTGGGGADLYPFRALHPDSVQYFHRHEFLNVAVDGNEAVIQAIGSGGEVFDQIHVNRLLPDRILFHSSWNSPQIPASDMTDGDGNVPGQKFNFIGQPIGGKLGQFSSSGRVFVNNDNHQLYLGFDEVMLHPGDELFLFVETPRSNGPPTMNGLASAYATNSLQTLDGLVFTNFSPSIGIVLGDEFGDGGFATFTRAGCSNNTGQGAFYLTERFPLVPGQRLTQFNHSPQDGPVTYEQNADFMQLALPFAALNLQPGDRVKVAAIVGLKSEGSRRRKLDSGIGYSMREAEGTNYLEAIEIQLEPSHDQDDDGLTDEDELLRGTDPHNPDSDGDGLPDGWEVANGFDPLKANSNDDADQDGMSNLAEFIAGTNPRDQSSRLSARVLRQPGALILEWSAVPGRLYKVQVRDGLVDPFRDVSDLEFPRRARSSVEQYRIEVSTASRAEYYRVLVMPE